MTFIEYAVASAGVTLGASAVILVVLLLLGCHNKVKELAGLARALKKKS